MAREYVPVSRLGPPVACRCGAQVRHRHGVPFEQHQGGAWREDEDGRFHRPGAGWGTHRVHHCATPPGGIAGQMTLEVGSWQ